MAVESFRNAAICPSCTLSALLISMAKEDRLLEISVSVRLEKQPFVAVIRKREHAGKRVIE
jgi:hypothetical protein